MRGIEDWKDEPRISFDSPTGREITAQKDAHYTEQNRVLREMANQYMTALLRQHGYL